MTSKMAIFAYMHALGTRAVPPPEPESPDILTPDDARIMKMADGMKEMVLKHKNEIMLWYNEYKMFRIEKLREAREAARKQKKIKRNAAARVEESEKLLANRGTVSTIKKPPRKQSPPAKPPTKPFADKKKKGVAASRKSGRINAGKN